MEYELDRRSDRHSSVRVEHSHDEARMPIQESRIRIEDPNNEVPNVRKELSRKVPHVEAERSQDPSVQGKGPCARGHGVREILSAGQILSTAEDAACH